MFSQNYPDPEDLTFSSDVRLEDIDRAVAALPEGPLKDQQRARVREAYNHNTRRTQMLGLLKQVSPETYGKTIEELTREDLLHDGP